MKKVHVGDACSKDEINNKYSLSETGTTYEYGDLPMATVKEVKLMKDGVIMAPVVLTDSVKNLDGTKFKDSIYTKDEIDAKISTLQNSIKETVKNIKPKKWIAINQSIFDSTTSVRSICYGNGKYVAASYGNCMAYSTDGVNWTALTTPAFGTSAIFSICYGDGKFVAGGQHAKIAYSYDGITWTAVANSPFDHDITYENINCVCYGNGKFVAASDGGYVAYSTDGATWTMIRLSDFSISCLCYGNGKFVSGGEDSGGQKAYSTDGITWVRVSDFALNNPIHSICYGNGKYIAASSGGRMAYSYDGITWTAVTNSFYVGGSRNSILTICYGNRKFVTGGESGKMTYCQVDVDLGF